MSRDTLQSNQTIGVNGGGEKAMKKMMMDEGQAATEYDYNVEEFSIKERGIQFSSVGMEDGEVKWKCSPVFNTTINQSHNEVASSINGVVM